MTTTNALTMLLRDAGLKKPVDFNVLPIDKSRAEMMDFSKVLDQVGTAVSMEKTETKNEYRPVEHSKLNETTDDSKLQKEEFGSQISEKIKSKDSKTVDEVVVTESIENFNEEIVSILCETLHVSPEELLAGMQELGLTIEDLLQPSNLANLFVAFGDDVTVPDILMSEEFQMVRTQVEQMLATMAKELDIPMEELVEIIENFENHMNSKVGTDESGKKQAMVEVVDVKQEETANLSKTENVETTEETTVHEENEPMNKQSDNSLMGGEEGNHETNEKMNAQKTNETEFKVHTDGQNDSIFKEFSTQTLRANVITTPEGTMIQETVKIVDLQNLVSEITEYVRLTSGNDFSKIEMQLNPENLGKMIVEVTSNHGEVTTKIIAQTQAGKEAVETNLANIRTNLEQQGVKVASVEVTVESHAFEQNLQGESSKEQEQLLREQQQENKKHQMNLNLNELTLDDLAGLMSEEEMITVRMMRENGNKIDLTV